MNTTFKLLKPLAIFILLFCPCLTNAQSSTLNLSIADPFNYSNPDTTPNYDAYQRLKRLQPNLAYTKIDKKNNTASYSLAAYFYSQENNSRSGPVDVTKGNFNTLVQQLWRVNGGYAIGKAIYYDKFLLTPQVFVSAGYTAKYKIKSTFKYIDQQNDTLLDNARTLVVPSSLELRLGAGFTATYFVKPKIGISTSCNYLFEYSKRLGSTQVTEVDYRAAGAILNYSRKDYKTFELNDLLDISLGVTLLLAK
jgi:hypothetical protein